MSAGTTAGTTADRPARRWIRGGQVLRLRSGQWDLESADIAISAGKIEQVVEGGTPPAAPG
jgi:hypothetical protein